MSLDNYDFSVTKHSDGQGFTINAREKNDNPLLQWVGAVVGIIFLVVFVKGMIFSSDDTTKETEPTAVVAETAKNNLEVAAWCAAANAVAGDFYDAQGDQTASQATQRQILAIQAPWAKNPAYREAAISAVDYMQNHGMDLGQVVEITNSKGCQAN